MMKKVTYLLTVLFALALINLGCEKENPNPDDEKSDVVLRISEVSYNDGDPISFVYNDNGLVTEINGRNEIFDYSIQYNDINQPVSVVQKYSSGELLYEYTIDWDEDGFTTSFYYTDESTTVTSRYDLDSEGRITDFGEWFENDSLVLDGYLSIKLDKNSHHPFSSINIAVIIIAGGIIEPDFFCYGNMYCPLRVDDLQDDDYYTHEYEFNKDGYPTKLIYRDNYGSRYYHYFEYETD